MLRREFFTVLLAWICPSSNTGSDRFHTRHCYQFVAHYGNGKSYSVYFYASGFRRAMKAASNWGKRIYISHWFLYELDDGEISGMCWHSNDWSNE